MEHWSCLINHQPSVGDAARGALERRECRGAHQRGDFPQLSPELRVNFQAPLDVAGHLTIDAQPIPPVPPELQAWAGASEEPSVAGRLLE